MVDESGGELCQFRKIRTPKVAPSHRECQGMSGLAVYPDEAGFAGLLSVFKGGKGARLADVVSIRLVL